jgi:hypothetical protein
MCEYENHIDQKSVLSEGQPRRGEARARVGMQVFSSVPFSSV